MTLIKRRQAYNLGILSEIYVMFYMFLRGYILIAHRYKTKFGEIDLIFRRFNTILAVEVKARSNNNITLEEVIKRKQINKIKNTLNMFLSKNEKYQSLNIRIDFILIKGIFNMEYIKGLQ
ncbi:MAG: YraN family protein [Rickettsiales bacterium]|nr:YraN family protein [Rickettsiales bacterium]